MFLFLFFQMSIRNTAVITTTVPHVMDITNTVDKILSGDMSGSGPLSLRNALKIHKMPSFMKPVNAHLYFTVVGFRCL